MQKISQNYLKQSVVTSNMWQEELKKQYVDQGKNTFILYGNIDDIFETSAGKDKDLSQFLTEETFGSRDVALTFNIGTGIKFRDEKSKAEWTKLLNGYDALKGTTYKEQLPPDSGEIFRLFNRFFHLIAGAKNKSDKKSICLIVSHAELLIPSEELNSLTLADKKVLVTLQEWATDKGLLAQDITIVLLTQSLHNLNPQLVADTDISKIKVDFPSQDESKETVTKFSKELSVQVDAPIEAIAKNIHGLNRKGIFQLFNTYKNEVLHSDAVAKMKKEMIEKENSDLIEFIESTKNLGMIAGHEKVVQRLREDAKLLKDARTEAIPMGYLICGPVGTGKSYLAECFAGEVGIPVVKIKNFRDKWVGSTEGNWEKIVTLLKNLAPVLVLVDEADAALGNREQEGDSGTSKRVFASLAQTMGDTANRGKLIWMLLTARPELLPIDLKRQGRAEVHLPLFYPKNVEEKYTFFEIIAKRMGFEKIKTVVQELTTSDLEQVRSGADVESILVKVKRWEYLNNQPITPEDFKRIVLAFRASISEEDIAHQTQAAIDEITDKELLD